jgi:hypothetical protein
MVAGMRVQAVVPRCRGSAAGGPGVVRQRDAGKSGRMRGAFSGVQSTNYWSSTTNADNPDNAWNVNLNDGNTNANDKDNTNLVWPVRGGA